MSGVWDFDFDELMAVLDHSTARDFTSFAARFLDKRPDIKTMPTRDGFAIIVGAYCEHGAQLGVTEPS